MCAHCFGLWTIEGRGLYADDGFGRLVLIQAIPHWLWTAVAGWETV